MLPAHGRLLVHRHPFACIHGRPLCDHSFLQLQGPDRHRWLYALGWLLEPRVLPKQTECVSPCTGGFGADPHSNFCMLGSDPIYQYDSGLESRVQGVITLEPTYSVGGGDPAWVDWFLGLVAEEPCLAFAYAQAGQENSFTWKRFGKSLTMQVERISRLAQEGKITVETMEQTGNWFRNRFEVTPATAVTATDDWKGEGRKTVWYNSRFYRINLLWEHDDFRIRDIHLFDQDYAIHI